MGYLVVCVGVFKIVDNDLFLIDCCFGFGLVVKYVVILSCEVGYDVVFMVWIFIKIFVFEVMGCYVGWIIVVCGLVVENVGELLYILLFFEVLFDLECFVVWVD